jgi:hypothetical protein
VEDDKPAEEKPAEEAANGDEAAAEPVPEANDPEVLNAPTTLQLQGGYGNDWGAAQPKGQLRVKQLSTETEVFNRPEADEEGNVPEQGESAGSGKAGDYVVGDADGKAEILSAEDFDAKYEAV